MLNIIYNLFNVKPSVVKRKPKPTPEVKEKRFRKGPQHRLNKKQRAIRTAELIAQNPNFGKPII